jgi:hypothetical protein
MREKQTMRKSAKQDKAWRVFLKDIVFPTFYPKQNNPQERQNTGKVRYCKSAIPTQQSLYNQTKTIRPLTSFSDTLESYVTNIQDVSSVFYGMSGNLSSYIFKVLLNTDNQNIINVKIKEPNVKRH